MKRLTVGLMMWLAATVVSSSSIGSAAGSSASVATTVLAADSDDDGLPDSWEAGPGRVYGCDPHHADLLVYAVQRTDRTADLNETIAGAVKFFAELNVSNPDGRRGIHLFVIRGPKIGGEDDYRDLRQRYFPANLNGRAHFHLFTTDPGGQTSCIGCADAASVSGVAGGWRTFVHELGHHLGLDHSARGFPIQSPLHASLMNYSYNFEFDGSPDRVQFSDGRFAKLRMRETDLDETLPLPAASVAFLAKPPYAFALRAVGDRTQVDWNRNGIFGEQHVRADINYLPSSYLGDRIHVEAAATAPAAAYHGDDLYVALGVLPNGGRGPERRGAVAAGARGLPTLRGPARVIVLRKWLGGDRWGPRIGTGLTNVIGDPSLVVHKNMLWVSASTAAGVQIVGLRPSGTGAVIDRGLSVTFPNRVLRQATLAVLDDRLFVFLREPSNRITYRVYAGAGNRWGDELDPRLQSRTPPGVAWNARQREAVIVVTADGNVPFRLAAEFRSLTRGELNISGTREWIGGAEGGNATNARPAVLVDTTKDAGPRGRVYAYYKASTPNNMAFFSMQVADSTFNGGWLERSAYDIWTTTASAPTAVVSPHGEITYCYRGPDNMVNCAFRGSGIEDGEMGDFDEMTFIRTKGLKSLSNK